MIKRTVTVYENETACFIEKDSNNNFNIVNGTSLSLNEFKELYKLIGEVLAENSVYVAPVKEPEQKVETAPRQSKFAPEVY